MALAALLVAVMAAGAVGLVLQATRHHVVVTLGHANDSVQLYVDCKLAKSVADDTYARRRADLGWLAGGDLVTFHARNASGDADWLFEVEIDGDHFHTYRRPLDERGHLLVSAEDAGPVYFETVTADGKELGDLGCPNARRVLKFARKLDLPTQLGRFHRNDLVAVLATFAVIMGWAMGGLGTLVLLLRVADVGPLRNDANPPWHRLVAALLLFAGEAALTWDAAVSIDTRPLAATLVVCGAAVLLAELVLWLLRRD